MPGTEAVQQLPAWNCFDGAYRFMPPVSQQSEAFNQYNLSAFYVEKEREKFTLTVGLHSFSNLSLLSKK